MEKCPSEMDFAVKRSRIMGNWDDGMLSRSKAVGFGIKRSRLGDWGNEKE